MFDNILKHFTHQDVVVFFVAFCAGVLFVCLVEAKPEIIVRWPTPDNAGLVTYVDRANNCYEYESKEVACTADAKNIPIQTGEGMANESDNQEGDPRASRVPTKTVVHEKTTWEKSFV